MTPVFRWAGLGPLAVMPAGSYVIHCGGEVHFDGAKVEETGHGAGDRHTGREAVSA